MAARRAAFGVAAPGIRRPNGHRQFTRTIEREEVVGAAEAAAAAAVVGVTLE